MAEAEHRMSDTEDKALRHERAIRYLFHRDVKLSAKPEDLESRGRRNNLRIWSERGRGKG